MSTAIGSAAFDRGVEQVRAVMTKDGAERLLAFRPDSAVQDRIEQLAEKANEGTLSAEEREEYEGYSRANKFIAILRSQARKRLTNG
jgi:hypothetical protein